MFGRDCWLSKPVKQASTPIAALHVFAINLAIESAWRLMSAPFLSKTLIDNASGGTHASVFTL
jgi:hypothetical protein